MKEISVVFTDREYQEYKKVKQLHFGLSNAEFIMRLIHKFKKMEKLKSKWEKQQQQ